MTPTQESFHQLMRGRDLDAPLAEALMEGIVDGALEDLQVAAVLGALAARGPTPAELAGFATSLTRHMVTIPGVPAETIDTCGTGGSGRPTLNTSTLAAVIASAAGATVAKHGNRSASGNCGSLDVLEALGARLDVQPEAERDLLRAHRFCFSNARARHPVLGRLGGLRRALGFRTVFNLLGPMLSPARVRRQLLGVSAPHLAPVLAGALAHLGRDRAWIVAGAGNLDEISSEGLTEVWAVEGPEVRRHLVDPPRLGLAPPPPGALDGGDVADNARRFRAILAGADLPAARDHAALNAGAALVVAELASDLPEGIERARAALEDGAALAHFEGWLEATRAVAPRGQEVSA